MKTKFPFLAIAAVAALHFGPGIINSNAQVCFNAAASFPGGGGSYSILSRDFNTDGKMDLAVANPGSNMVAIFLGNGVGSFGAAANFPVSVFPRSITSADFDGDGKADLAVCCASTISVLLGNGAGSFGAANNFSSTGGYSIASADFDGDGKIDLAVANNSPNSVSIFPGNGAGGFGAPSNFSVGTAPYSIIQADFNADGKIDLATANNGSGNVSILLGNGAGSFGAAANFPVVTNLFSIVSADFNGDGKIDLATVSSNGSNNMSILLGNGAGSFGAAVNFSSAGSYNAITSGDFDLDGKADLALGKGTPGVAVFLGNGAGSFGAATIFSVSNSPNSIISADFNGDGKADLATGFVEVLLNCHTPTALTAGISAQTNPLCNGQCTGTATVNPSGGTPPYTYSWNTSPLQHSQTATGLCAGNYTIIVSDVASTVTKTVTITQPTVLTTSVNVVNASSCAASDGAICVSPSGGMPGYTYAWLPSGAITSCISGLVPGTYTCTIRDANNCTHTTTATVSCPNGVAQLSQQNDISVYPNPSAGMFNVQGLMPARTTVQSGGGNGNTSTIDIYNVLGKKVYTTLTVSHQPLTIDLSSQPDGIYFLYIKTEKQSFAQKIIIQK